MLLAAIRHRFTVLPANLKGAVVLMVAALFFSVMVATIKLLGQQLHITQILLVRQIIMTAIVAPAIMMGFSGSLRTTRFGLQLARVVFALIGMLAGFSAVIHLPLADATAIGFAKSFFVTIFAVFILAETVGPRRWFAVALGFVGVLIMMRPGTDAFSIYGLYALIGAAGAGAVMIMIRIMARTDSPTTIMTYQALGVGLAMAVPGIYFWQWPDATQWILIVVMGLVSYLGQYFNILAYKWGEASFMASLDYVRLLYATAWGFVLFGTLPQIGTWIGAGIIIAASIYTIRREAMRKQALTRAPDGRGYAP